MRRLELIVLAESILLAMLGFAWLMRSGARPEPIEVNPRAHKAPGAPRDRTAPVDSTGAKNAPAITDARRKVDTPSREAAAARIVLRGRVLPPMGGELPDALGISLRRDGRYHDATIVGDQYAVAGLAPGTWTLRPTAREIASRSEPIEITDAALQFHDVQLERASIVKVFLRTLDGAPLVAPTDWRFSRGLTVVALTQPLSGDLPPTDNSNVGPVGLGHWHDMHSPNGAVDPGGADGILQLDTPPPLHAALLLRHVVLAQQVIPAGATELVFIIDRATLDARFATVRLRLVDAVSGTPLTTDAHVSFSTAQGGGGSGRPATDGTCVVERILPGIVHMEIGAEDHESISTDFAVRPGETLDLGEVLVHAPLRLRGRLKGPDGGPVSGTVMWTDLDSRRARGTLADHRSTAADGDGEFTLGGGPRRYLIAAMSSDGLHGATVIDARGGAPPEIEVRLARAVRLIVAAAGDPLRGYALEVIDARDQLVAARRIEARWREATFQLAPGHYTLEVYDDADTLRQRIPLQVPLQAQGDTMRLEVK